MPELALACLLERYKDVTIAWVPGKTCAGATDGGRKKGGTRRAGGIITTPCATNVACTTSAAYIGTSMHLVMVK